MKKEAIIELEKIFKLLGNKQRLIILELLRERSYSVSEIINSLGMEQSAVSHQLKLLREAQLVETEKRGREVLYGLSDSHILILLDNALKHVSHTITVNINDRTRQVKKEKPKKG
ncbi:ArsR/SmtB family transcription factor [Leuconostoc mesenteroides]|uniref:Transcriptional regulator, ArsR family n=1 Tax=Leuconostoc mesenteroides subsp. cremoris ATCC 19254 TaxID=586220 RepID=C2KLS6_LEUMC|nr:metalloregulator ArsR/SmtB family transcription factor [Leuconostoc mesenteroides]KDA51035.1 putative transcriptional regulator [Leuconostoc mesenteroides subsp. cremoris T26]EEJ41820.1 transcriptional regulator, ArsR family [Leuconostoc mesenteroides subsp. cremoris ATCC 19254]MDG9750912.1 metalloregulator ArsR/SmtB family transcription factor [Leuconostoc mesenteroides]ORI39365.1 transcriptional regulator [Leuconostoc mesenteroides subsp. cremoris]ORI39430.1 transcriptional regulator [Leu